MNIPLSWIGIFCSLKSINIWAETNTDSIVNTETIVQTFLALLLVIMIMFLSAWVIRRLNPALKRPGRRSGQVTEFCVVGSKERVVLLEMSNERLLLGVTAQQITLLKDLNQLNSNE
ncbi:MAG: flagellar biosynthetic protein FliO [Endozoicomonadaceae bacterium]|nr:flagellar biosynthetic protein FliO [Endozoicomonadaceae bacterium]